MVKRNQALKNFRRDYSLYIMVLIPIVYIFIFSYIPMGGIFIAFKQYRLSDGFLNSLIHGNWVGLRYFRQFFRDPIALMAIKNTILIGFYSILFGFPAPIILALMFNELRGKVFKRVSQTISYIPHFVSTVIVVGMMMQILSPSTGIINRFIVAMGGEAVYFMTRPEWFRPLYIISDIWQGIGWGSIIYLASIASLDPSIYEAAEIDGAGRFSKIFHITIPGIMPTIIIMLLMRTGSILNIGFEKILLMQGDGDYSLTRGVSEVIDSLVYRRGVQGGEFSFGTAVGLFKSLVGLIMLTFANSVSRKFSETSLW